MDVRKQLLQLVPDMEGDILRLHALLTAEPEPTVTVIGKYNHGKSRLLNELIGSDVFLVADKRQTVDLDEHLHNGVRWLDAPGLDADVASNDDRLALWAAWLKADIRLFVHTAKEGELDKTERDLLSELRDNDQDAWRQTLFVLSQVDQLDEEQLRLVVRKIESQVSGLTVHCVSPAMYRKGRDEQKLLLQERSGLDALREALHKAVQEAGAAREHEIEVLSGRLEQSLKRLRSEQKRKVTRLQRKQEALRDEFRAGLLKALGGVARSRKKKVDPLVPLPVL